MNSNSNGQSPTSADSSPVGQTQPPAPPQQPSVPSNSQEITGNTQNQPRTRTGTQTPPHNRAHNRTATQFKRQFWFRILSGGDNLVNLAEKLLAVNFGAVIALSPSRIDGSLFRYLSSNLADAKSFDTVVAFFAIGFTCNMHVILLKRDSPIAAKIAAYAGALSSVIGFLTMIQILLPPTLLWIVWSAAASIFLSFVYHFTNNWVNIEDGNVDTEGENVWFYWGGEIVSDDHQGVSYNCDVKKLCKVEKGTTLRQLEAMIKPEVAPDQENVQLKFKALGLIGRMLGIQHASRLAALNEKLISIKVGDFCHVKEGNFFSGSSMETESAIVLGKHGFINYFGLQIKAAAKRIYVCVSMLLCR